MEGEGIGFANWRWAREEVKVAAKRGFPLFPLIQSQSNNQAVKWLWNLYKCM